MAHVVGNKNKIEQKLSNHANVQQKQKTYVQRDEKDITNYMNSRWQL